MTLPKSHFWLAGLMVIVVSGLIGGTLGAWLVLNEADVTNHLEKYFKLPTKQLVNTRVVSRTEEESSVITVVEQSSPAVVSIAATQDIPIIRQSPYDPFFDDFFGLPTPGPSSQLQEVSNGTGFVVSADGYIITNRHVVAVENADYSAITNDGTRYDATVLARDPILDLAIIKIEATNLPTLPLGDSSNLQVGQTVVAIGNALGEFRNTVSTGVVSGLARSIIAGTQFGAEELVDLIQTDASINPGNSGGPLLDLGGNVIGINTAVAASAQNIGFAIPINSAKRIIDSVREHGRIVLPWLGIRYVSVDPVLAKANDLSVDYGALVIRGDLPTDLAVAPGSPADRAGIVENDIILEINGERLTTINPLTQVLAKHAPGEEITIKFLHRGEEKTVKTKLVERKI